MKLVYQLKDMKTDKYERSLNIAGSSNIQKLNITILISLTTSATALIFRPFLIRSSKPSKQSRCIYVHGSGALSELVPRRCIQKRGLAKMATMLPFLLVNLPASLPMHLLACQPTYWFSYQSVSLSSC